MHNSVLSEHTKKGDTLYTPYNYHLGKTTKFSFWSRDKLPEYLWIGLIFSELGRSEAMSKLLLIMKRMATNQICLPEISTVLSWDEERQNKWFDALDEFLPVHILSPLSIVLSSSKYPFFFKRYCCPEISVEKKIGMLMSTVKECMSFHSNMSTDICYIIIQFLGNRGKIVISAECPATYAALVDYPHHPYGSPMMEMYGANIRSTFQAVSVNNACEFSHYFWETLSQITPCNPMCIKLEEANKRMDTSFAKDLSIVYEYIEASSGDKMLTSKFSVVMGMSTYIYKLYSEISSNNLWNTISSRVIFRTMTEAYINLKYLMLKEEGAPEIYDAFMNYGLGKYKLVMSKLREQKYSPRPHAHLDSKLMECLVNEVQHENFTNIPLGYFDKDTIKKKFEITSESELYEIYYEYDTNYTHAMWGAVRESSMLLCDNPSHLYHSVPDYHYNQHLLDIEADCNMIMDKLIKLISSYVDIPEFYQHKYIDCHD